jgi:hypothetical protein
MFCSNCGNADQEPDTYCRQCGEYLVDPVGNSYFLNKVLGGATPVTQINVNLVISFLTIFACFFLIGFLKGHYDALFTRSGELPPVVIYWVYAFLGLISVWQLFSFVVGMRLRKKLSRKGNGAATERGNDDRGFDAMETQELLPEADFSRDVPSVTEEPTKILDPVTRIKN